MFRSNPRHAVGSIFRGQGRDETVVVLVVVVVVVGGGGGGGGRRLLILPVIPSGPAA